MHIKEHPKNISKIPDTTEECTNVQPKTNITAFEWDYRMTATAVLDNTFQHVRNFPLFILHTHTEK